MAASRGAMERVERTAKELNAIPWWKPLKRQEAGRRYRWALYLAACEELGC